MFEINRRWLSSLVYYSLVQLDGNSFCGDVVLDIFNMAYGDKDII